MRYLFKKRNTRIGFFFYNSFYPKSYKKRETNSNINCIFRFIFIIKIYFFLHAATHSPLAQTYPAHVNTVAVPQEPTSIVAKHPAAIPKPIVADKHEPNNLPVVEEATSK